MNIEKSSEFEKDTKHLDGSVKSQIRKIIEKIINNPTIAKPMVYIPDVFSERVEGKRLVYYYKNNHLLFLCYKSRDDVYEYLKGISKKLHSI